jgi:sugar/nucleoside kinase (ribokinase family)
MCPNTRITGIGSALVDILINESDEFLNKFNKAKGGMTLVDDSDIKKILGTSLQTPIAVPGGAACNTIMGVGRLGGKARFIGHRGNDTYGKNFEEALIKSQVEPVMSVSDAPTGKVLSVITPDAQRSMFTFLGASTKFDPSSVTATMFNDTAIAMIEGYLLFNRELMLSALKSAKAAGAMIALDLASFEVVNSSKGILDNIIREYVDILIANEDEARAFTGFTDEKKAIKALAENVSYAVLKVGAKGSYIAQRQEILKIPAQKGKSPVDTTGAGDLWASGFLFGLANGFSIEKSGRLGSACGYEVCQVIGAQIPESAWDRIRKQLYGTGC